MNTWRNRWFALAALAAISLGPMPGWAVELSPEVKTLAAAHQQAALEARQKVTFHEKMEREFVTGRGGSKIDMVGHCRYWADYYRKLAAQEEKAAKELE